jgi:hypothetical protein
MIRKYIIVADDSIKGFDEGIAKLEREWGAEEIEPCDDCISREEAIRVAEQGQIQGYEWEFKKLCNLPSVTPSIPDVENDFNLGYNCGYTDAMIDIAEGE